MSRQGHTGEAAGGVAALPRYPQACSWILVLLTATVLWHARPLIAGYCAKLIELHGPRVTLLAAAGGALAFFLLSVSLWHWPQPTVLATLMAAVTLASTSGNLGALLIAAAILALTLVAGDAVARLVRGTEADHDEELILTFAVGTVSIGLTVLLLGEARLLVRPALLSGALGLLVLRRSSLRTLGLRVCRAAKAVGELRPSNPTEAGWAAFAVVALMAVWVGVLSPEVSWDGLAYHLPEVRDIVLKGRIAPLAALAPQTLFWRNHESFLAAGFFFGGEPAARLLHFAVGLGGFAAGVALVRRLGEPGARPLMLLSLVAFPFACYQLRATYVDWPAAFLVAASAVAVAAGGGDSRRVRLGVFLFSAAIVVKVTSVFAAPALLLLAWRRQDLALRRFPVLILVALAPLLPWLAWSQSRAGYFLAPYATSGSSLISRLTGGYFFMSPAAMEHESGPSAPQAEDRSLRAFTYLPYSLTYHTSRFEGFRDGYGGVLALLILPGALGWGLRRAVWFSAAALGALVPWYLMHDPSYRYLLPLYPLYAAFVAGGLWRLTKGFEGHAGRVAAVCLLAAALAFPVQLGSSGIEWRVATGFLSPREALAAQLPSYPLWHSVGPKDRVVFLGEFDRYHCGCERAYRIEYDPVSRWGLDPALWKAGLAELSVDYVAYRDRENYRQLVDGLSGSLQLIAENRDARLYRVKR